jgi:hypothetical protein
MTFETVATALAVISSLIIAANKLENRGVFSSCLLSYF